MTVTRLVSFRRWGHLTWPGDMALADLDLQFLGKFRNSCPNSCAKKKKNGGASRFGQSTLLGAKKRTAYSKATRKKVWRAWGLRNHDVSKHRYYFLRWLKVTPSNNIWGLLWYINTKFFIGDWMLWRNSKGVATKFWLGGGVGCRIHRHPNPPTPKI